MFGVRKNPEFDVAVLLGKLVVAFADFVPAPFLDLFDQMKGGDDGDLDLGRDAEQPERQPLGRE